MRSKLNPERVNFLDYLRKGFGYGKDFCNSESLSISHENINLALKHFSKTDPLSWDLLHTWMTSNLDMEGMSRKHHWPPHTIRRRLYACVDALMNWIQTETYKPVDENITMMSHCEIFQKSLLLAFKKLEPELLEEIKKSIKITNSIRRKGKQHGH
jgi:hypothetical protein